MIQTKVIHWTQPNRENAPPLHIESRGTRYPTLSGVAWLDEFRFVVVHRCGFRLALFDTRKENPIVAVAEIPHRADDLAAKRISESSWELCLSGCWDVDYSIYEVTIAEEIVFNLKRIAPQANRTFSHGIKYGADGEKCLAFSSGQDPRVEIGSQVTRIPESWGPRSVFFDKERSTFFMVAVSDVPKTSQCSNVAASIWHLNNQSNTWEMRFSISDAHMDNCEVYADRIWLGDQKSDRVIGICLRNENQPIVIQGDCFDFPHGLAISNAGMLAVTNYGNSSVVLIDLNQVIQRHTESHQGQR